MNKNKKWCLLFLFEFVFLLTILGSMTIIIDPFFHYHKPLSFLQYPINNQRYQNDGIVRHFDYDAIITGTSMADNFKTTEMDRLFDCNSIKVTFTGGAYKELNQNLEKAIKNNDNIRYVVRSLDLTLLIRDRDYRRYELDSYPTYLYDNILYNDVKYIFNKEVLLNNTFKVLNYTLDGNTTTSFDDYSSWASSYKYGKEALDSNYTRTEKIDNKIPLVDIEIDMIKNNVEQNLLQIAKDNPDIQFYYFYPPYSIYYWDSLNNTGEISKYIEAEKMASEMLLSQENIHLFSFWDEMDVITNLDNYKDNAHYGERINSLILKWMVEDRKRLTEETYDEYYDMVLKTFTKYDYEQLFK